jgi:hypothetical protein
MTINPNRAPLPCSRCGKIAKCWGASDGGSYCGSCYRNLSVSVCLQCKRQLRYHSPHAPPQCRKCELSAKWRGKSCAHCGATILAKGYFGDGKAYCCRCRYWASPDRKCMYCSRMARGVSRRNSLGMDKPACTTCVTRRLHLCRVCGRYRLRAGEVAGRPACAACVKRGTVLDGVCSVCGNFDKAPNTSGCLGCRAIGAARSTARKLHSELRQEWVKNLLADYADAVGIETRPLRVIPLITSNAEAFRRIDRGLANPEELSLSNLIVLFKDQKRWAFRSLKDWLNVAYGIDFASPDADLQHHHLEVTHWLSVEPEEWIRETLRKFYQWMYSRRGKMLAAKVRRGRSPLKLSSIRSAAGTAAMFLRHCSACGVDSFTAVSQTEIESFTTKHPKFNGLSAFVRYADTRHRRFQALTLPHAPPRPSTLSRVLPVATQREAVKRWLAASDGPEFRNALIALLSLFYAQKPSRLLTRTLDDVRIAEDAVEMKFSSQFVTIDEPIAGRMRTWLATRRLRSPFGSLAANPYLFPGGTPTKAFSAHTFSTWLLSQQITVGQLFATSLHSLIRAGMDDPSVLVDGLGLTRGTAVRYWLDAGADLDSNLYVETIQSFRAAGHMEKTHG